MKVRVEFFGPFHVPAGTSTFIVDQPSNSHVVDVIRDIARTYGPPLATQLLPEGVPASTLFVAVNQQQAGLDTVLHENDTLMVMLPISGGQ